jgi:hypothetical protein
MTPCSDERKQSSEWLPLHDGFVNGLLFDSEDGDYIVFLNIT